MAIRSYHIPDDVTMSVVNPPTSVAEQQDVYPQYGREQSVRRHSRLIIEYGSSGQLVRVGISCLLAALAIKLLPGKER